MPIIIIFVLNFRQSLIANLSIFLKDLTFYFSSKQPFTLSKFNPVSSVFDFLVLHNPSHVYVNSLVFYCIFVTFDSTYIIIKNSIYGQGGAFHFILFVDKKAHNLRSHLKLFKNWTLVFFKLNCPLLSF